MSHEISDVLTNVALPKTQATITLRVIKSFAYRTERSLILHMLNLEITTVGELQDMARRAIQTSSGWKPYRNVHLDTLKLYTKAHGAKTTNLIINMDHDDWIFDDDARTLAELGIENETEISFFNRVAYNAFKENPEIRWDIPP